MVWILCQKSVIERSWRHLWDMLIHLSIIIKLSIFIVNPVKIKSKKSEKWKNHCILVWYIHQHPPGFLQWQYVKRTVLVPKKQSYKKVEHGTLWVWLLIWCFHDDVMKWKHFPCYWPFVRGIHRSPLKPPHKGQWRGALVFSLICTRINGWVNNGEAGDLKRYRAHYDVTVMFGKWYVIRCWLWLLCIYIQLQFNRTRTHSLITKCVPANII